MNASPSSKGKAKEHKEEEEEKDEEVGSEEEESDLEEVSFIFIFHRRVILSIAHLLFIYPDLSRS